MNRYSLDQDGLDGVFNPEQNTNEPAKPDQNAFIKPENLNSESQTKSVSSKRPSKLALLATIVATGLVSLVVISHFGSQKNNSHQEEETSSTSPLNAEASLEIKKDDLLLKENIDTQNQVSAPENKKITPASETTDYVAKDSDIDNLSTRKTDTKTDSESTPEFTALEKKVEANIAKYTANKQSHKTISNDSINAAAKDKSMPKNFPTDATTSNNQSANTAEPSKVDAAKRSDLSQTNMPPELLGDGSNTSAKTAKLLLQFNFDTTDLSHLQQSKKVALITFAQECKKNIIVTGHTCNIGSGEVNWAVGLARAEATKIFLNQKGIPAKKITINSLGEKQPIASNDTFEGRKQNRFVTIRCSVN